ncbi:type III-B CRISPR module RAMP protein Cmr6 [Thermoactinomyces sp. CICC 10523]|uniref:type III-B CRISPR module RAMP protein Cmr6 n=1 Tax=Thermoactinomyces sp. CICC 10523 TaxID=2767428 RepID=UPI0018DC7122|nr:type III-B CRISPR module RAMP protein Cmr6 [Thermoactinomyces sp. CICC 10523]MBH8599293.1 type III-B CRISPR module RAMP protein Cmr6 [Thermoactinomyces sp. CICC 10523]
MTKRNWNETFLPLYNRLSVAYSLTELKQNPHAGLWYEKFCHQWTWDTDKKTGEIIGVKLDKNKRKWIETVTKAPVGDEKRISQSVERLKWLVQERKGEFFHMKTTSRLIPGMGRSHPVENGIIWHPALGVPYLPGSSVKGLVRAWATSYASEGTDEWREKNEIISRIFGPEESDRRAGSVIFFDALPIRPLQLEMDIMTPHYQEYYKNPKQNSPREWESPNPIPFLTVAEEQPFIFAIAPRRLNDKHDLDKVINWLKEALVWIGAGAKTAVGYGRFEEIKI